MRTTVLAGICLLGFFGGWMLLRGSSGAPTPPPTPPPPPLGYATFSSLEKIRPDRPLPEGGRELRLRAARGECEAAQIALVAPREAIHGIDASWDAEWPGGVKARLFRVGVVTLDRPSGPEGQAGRWPDPLIPAHADGQKRNAFPFDLAAGEPQSVLVDLCVASDHPPGPTTRWLRLGSEEIAVTVPVHLQVSPFVLPATSSLPTSFGVSSRRAALGHFGRIPEGEELLALDRIYRRALLAHRISAHGGTMDPPPFRVTGPGSVEIDFQAYDEELGPFLGGSALPSGARATTTELRTHPALPDDAHRIAYWRAIVAHHRKKGWDALLFEYAKDEPNLEDLPAVAERARLVKRADPGIRVLLTASYHPSLRDLIDIWTPNLNCLWVKKSADEYCKWRHPFAAYLPLRQAGAQLWWYQSCSSHGCDDVSIGGVDAAPEYFRGWPSYVVDAPGTRARLMAWLAFREGIEGELYWDTVHAYAPDGEPKDPWDGKSLFAFGGNGDGTFFYPGTPARIGGSSHVPVPSLRLLHIRDGLEDYELLRAVARHVGEARAREAVHRLAPEVFRVSDDPAALEARRLELFEVLEARLAAPRE